MLRGARRRSETYESVFFQKKHFSLVMKGLKTIEMSYIPTQNLVKLGEQFFSFFSF